MKKLTSLVLALIMSLALCLPAYAVPPRTVSGSSASYLDDYDGGGGRLPTPPNGYTYLTSHNGNTTVDAAWNDAALTISGVIVGGLPWAVGTVLLIDLSVLSAQTIDSLKNTGRLSGYYTEYVFACNDPGIYPYIYWHCAYFYSDSARTNYIGQNSYYEYALLPR